MFDKLIGFMILSLLSGCSGGVYEKTLKPEIATIVATAVTSYQTLNDGTAYVDSESGNIVSKTTVTSTVSQTASDSVSTQNPNATTPLTITYEVTVTRPGVAPYTLKVESTDGVAAAKAVEKDLITAGANGSGYKIDVVNAQLGAPSYTISNNGPLNVGTNLA
jgi:Fe-S cluster assembly iron-binding protein IscA